MGFKFKKLRPKLVEKDEAAILPLKSEKKKKFNRKCTVQTQVKTTEIKRNRETKSSIY